MNIDKHPEKNKWISACLKNDRRAQKLLYEWMSPTMISVCTRYLSDKHAAPEVMNQGFLKVFTKISDYRNDGSFEGWVRRIMVNTCLDENKKYVHNDVYADEFTSIDEEYSLLTTEESDIEYIIKMIDQLPLGLKTIFNMTEIEGYTHKETAELLGIAESASRSQLSKAKAALRQMIEAKKL